MDFVCLKSQSWNYSELILKLNFLNDADILAFSIWKKIFWSTDWRVEIRWQRIIRQTRRFLFSHIVVSIHVSGTHQLRHIFRLEWPTQLKFHGIDVRSITMGARFWSAFFPYLYSLFFFLVLFPVIRSSHFIQVFRHIYFLAVQNESGKSTVSSVHL